MEIYNTLEESVDASLTYGRALVVIDKYNHVAAILFGQDMRDIHNILQKNPDLRDRTQKHHEIYGYVDMITGCIMKAWEIFHLNITACIKYIISSMKMQMN